MMTKKLLGEMVCPKCGYKDTVGHGSNLTKSGGNRRRRKCKRCASTFYVEDKKNGGQR